MPAWNPYLKGDIALIEKVQHRASKIPHSLKGLEYAERCAKWNLTSLEKRRSRSDLIAQYKILKGINRLNWHYPPCVAPPRANHRERFRREIVKNCQQRFHFFNNRVATAWNALPNDIVESNSVAVFTTKLDQYLTRQAG